MLAIIKKKSIHKKIINMKKNLFLLGIILIAVFTSCNKPKISCEIIKPLPNSTFELGAVIDISVVVDAENTNISEVQIYLDGAGYQSKSFFPFNFNIYTSNLELGHHTIRAVAIASNDLKSEQTTSFNLVKYESPDFVSFANGILPEGWKSQGWTICSPGYDDDYSIRSQWGELFAIKTCDVNINCIEFYAKEHVGSPYYDTRIAFFINNYLVENIYLSENWEKFTFDIPQGEHTFSWRAYSGDGSNYAYLDAIKFFKK